MHVNLLTQFLNSKNNSLTPESWAHSSYYVLEDVYLSSQCTSTTALIRHEESGDNHWLFNHKAGCLNSPYQPLEAWKVPGDLLVPILQQRLENTGSDIREGVNISSSSNRANPQGGEREGQENKWRKALPSAIPFIWTTISRFNNWGGSFHINQGRTLI